MYDIKAILFDKDGTLWGFQKTWSPWAEKILSDISAGNAFRRENLAKILGYDLEKKEFRPDSLMIAGAGDEIVTLLAPHVPELEKSDLYKLLESGAREVRLAETVPLEPLFRQLEHAGLKLGIATNDFEGVARDHLGPLAAYFDFIAGCDTGFGAKPDPGMLLAFSDQLGLAPEQVLMVGDSRHDLLAGRAAGMKTLGVLTGVAKAEELADLSDDIRPNIGAILDLLKV